MSAKSDRPMYNAMRQTMVDMGKQDSMGYQYTYPMVSKVDYSAVKQLMARMDNGTTYDHNMPSNLLNYYEYLDYFAMSAEIPKNYKDAIEFIQPTIQAAKRLGTDAEKVTYLLRNTRATRQDHWKPTTNGRKTHTPAIPTLTSAGVSTTSMSSSQRDAITTSFRTVLNRQGAGRARTAPGLSIRS